MMLHLANIVSLIIVIFYFYFVKSCPISFRKVSNICVWIKPSPIHLCDAWRICIKKNARLPYVTDMPVIINNRLIDPDYGHHAGIHDLLYERYTNKSGWLDGKGVKMMNIRYWGRNWPSNMTNADCVFIHDAKQLRNAECNIVAHVICVYDSYPNMKSKVYKKNNLILFNNDDDMGCYDLKVARSRIECAMLSLQLPYYKSFYYDEMKKNCTLTKYIDSTLPRKLNISESNWQRFD